MRLIVGDCVETMRSLDQGSVDAVVTDPPYGLRFMGKEWDDAGDGAAQQEWHRRWAVEALRVLKPGGHLLAFGGSRTYHRLASAVEEAGFEVRDQMMWLYGSGFPKSLDVSKAINKAAGAERKVIGEGRFASRRPNPDETGMFGMPHGDPLTAPATPAAAQWQGWGTALKPAHEPIVVARTPLIGTVAANVLAFGTGALNVDGCRVGTDLVATRHTRSDGEKRDRWEGNRSTGETTEHVGRWPANVVLDPVAAAMLDEQSGEQRDGVAVNRNRIERGAQGVHVPIKPGTLPGPDVGYGGSGGASRFFYCAKASSRERNAGLDGFDRISGGALNMRNDAHAHSTGNASSPRANVHPTVKPVDLMRYLVRLVTPPGGVVLDPFTGSGTTGIAAALEGMDFIGCEREQEYADIARARIEWWTRHAGAGDTDDILAAAEQRERVSQDGQLDLLGKAA